MATQVQLRRGTSTQNDSFTGAQGELTFDTTNKRVRIHDGATTGGFELKTENSSGDTLFADNEKAIFGAGSDLQIYHDGSNSYITDTGTGNLRVQADDFYVFNAAGNSVMISALDTGKVGLGFAGTEKFATTATGINVTGVITTDGMTTSADINFGDNDKAIFGASSDLQIYHDGSNSYIRDNGTGGLVLEGSTLIELKSRLGEVYFRGAENGAVTLYNDNAPKLATTSTGIDVTGTVTADGINSSGNFAFTTADGMKIIAKESVFINIDSDDNDSNRSFSVTSGSSTSLEYLITATEDAGVTLYYDNAPKLATTSTGIDVTGTATMDRLGLGVAAHASAGLNITTTNQHIRLNNGSELGIIDLDSDGELNIWAHGDGEVINLRTGSGSGTNIVKVDSTGIDVTGTVNADGLTVGDGTGAESIRIDKGVSSAASIDFYSGGASSGKIEYNVYEHLVTSSAGPTYLKTNNVNRMQVGSNGDISFYEDTGTTAKFFWDASAESLGIGTVAPARDLHIVENDNWAQIRLEGNSSGGAEIMMGDSTTESKGRIQYVNGSNYMRFDTNATERMRIDSSGKVGMGITPLSFSDLMVNTATNRNIGIFDNATGATIGGLTNAGASAALRLAGSPLIMTGGGGSGSEHMRIDSSGQVGIGTDSPSVSLEIYKADPYIRLTDSVAPTGYSQVMGTHQGGLILSADYSNSVADSYLGFHVDGSEAMRIDSSGRVGIGTSSPDSNTRLHIKDANIAVLRIEATGANKYPGINLINDAQRYDLQIDGATDSLRIYDSTNSTTRFVIDNSGNVGIGTSSPDYPLHVKGTTNILKLETSTDGRTQVGGYDSSGNANFLIGSSDSTNAEFWNYKNGYLRFATNSTERMRIDSSGNVGIGTSSVGTINSVQFGGVGLHVKQGTLGRIIAEGSQRAELILNDSGSSTNLRAKFIKSDGGVLSLGSLADSSIPTQHLTIDASGNVGIGTSSPSHKLHVSGSNSAARFSDDGTGYNLDIEHDTTNGITTLEQTNSGGDIRLKAGTASGLLMFDTGGSEAMRIDSLGNLLVGQSSSTLPSNTSGVYGMAIRGDGVLSVAGNSTAVGRFNRNNSDGDILGFYKNGATVGSIGAYSGDVYIGEGDTALRFNANNDLILPFNSTSGSQATRDAAIDLGTTGGRFKDLYLSGGVYLAGTGVVNPTSANKLEDYEEGTCNLKWSDGTNHSAAASSKYTKVGRAVTVSGYVSGNVSGLTGTEVAQIAGFPFAFSDYGSFAVRLRYIDSPTGCIGIVGQHANSGSVAKLSFIVDNDNYSNVLVSDLHTTGNDTYFNITYTAS